MLHGTQPMRLHNVGSLVMLRLSFKIRFFPWNDEALCDSFKQRLANKEFQKYILGRHPRAL